MSGIYIYITYANIHLTLGHKDLCRAVWGQISWQQRDAARAACGKIPDREKQKNQTYTICVSICYMQARDCKHSIHAADAHSMHSRTRCKKAHDMTDRPGLMRRSVIKAWLLQNYVLKVESIETA